MKRKEAENAGEARPWLGVDRLLQPPALPSAERKTGTSDCASGTYTGDPDTPPPFRLAAAPGVLAGCGPRVPSLWKGRRGCRMDAGAVGGCRVLQERSHLPE